MADEKSPKRKKTRRFAASAAGPGEQFVDWARAHGAIGACVLALVCAAALVLLVWFVVFSDFSASADFVYNQF